jgi:predicted phage terminase large subunit-like protein
MTTLVKQKPVSLNKIALQRSLCKEDYYYFVQTFWDEVCKEDPVWNWHIRILCNEIQKVCERIIAGHPKRYDLIINVPPGTTKSLLCSIMLLPWLWTRMPSFRFLGGSFNAELALDFGNKARRLIRSDQYQEMFPEIQIRDDQDTKGYFANTLGGERYSTSTGASIIGKHFHLHIIDDPINPKGARSILELKEANLWMSEAVAQRCVNRAITALILVMQRLGLDDPSGIRLARTGGTPIRHICLPAEVSDDVRPLVLRNKYKNGLLDPVRLNKEILANALEELSPYGYAGQYEQRPTPLTGGMFEVNKIHGPAVPPNPSEFKYVMRWWDKSASQGKGDYTAGVLMGIKKNSKDFPIYWVLDVIRKQVGSTERERIIRNTAEFDRVKYEGIYRIGLEQEPGSGGKDSVIATTQKLDGFIVFSERPTGSKMDRAHEFACQVGGENVAIAPGVWNKTYIEELQYFGPLCRHDDQVDASSGVFNWLSRRKFKLGAVGI